MNWYRIVYRTSLGLQAASVTPWQMSVGYVVNLLPVCVAGGVVEGLVATVVVYS